MVARIFIDRDAATEETMLTSRLALTPSIHAWGC
jgi:hypothetical protein